MTRQVGERLTDGARRRGIRQLQTLVGAGVSDIEACEQVMQRYDVSSRSARYWLKAAYEEMAAEADVDRKRLVGSALRTRRLILAQAMKRGDFRLALAAADAISRLLGLDAPLRTQQTVLIEKVSDMSRAVIDVVRDHFADRPEERARFVQALQTRLNAQIARKPEPLALVIDAESEDVAPVESRNEKPIGAPIAIAPPTVDNQPS